MCAAHAVQQSSEHIPVLAEPVRRLAAAKPGEVWVDCTLGFGGHTADLLAAGARVYGVDRDPQARAATAARLAPYADRFSMLSGDFRHVAALLAAEGVEA
ncbi:MAG: 16S rRNA (cytosine(1402)-N(4))-methyltransferase, partial [Myxococcales bacterium]|nr:16S rRNA (cytosine(1402)-N(4))-methyltransferase [Myxococcales bacterium]